MKKLSLIVAISLATTGSAFAGGLNQAVTDEVIDPPAAAVRGSSGYIVPLLLLGVVAAAAASTNRS